MLRVTNLDNDSVLQTTWRLQNRWSQAADYEKRSIERARTWVLRLTTAGAVLSTTSAQMSHWNADVARVPAIIAAVGLATASVIGGRATRTAVRDWTRIRSVSEALKTEIYTYLAGVGRYRGDNRRELLQDQIDKIGADAGRLDDHIAGIAPQERPLPDVHDVPTYIEVRLNGQIDGYYRPKAKSYRTKVNRFRTAGIWLTGVAAVLAALTGFFPHAGLSEWVAVVTTAGAAIAAHAAAQRYEYQQIEFARTGDQLERLRTRYEIGRHDTPADDHFVEECERVISIQNEGWMAKLTRGDDD
jgi:hypothetical protein